MSDPSVWGPSLWRILHTLAERLGKNTNSILIMDEQRAWINFLHSVENIIPCKRCKEHFRVWCRKYPIEAAVVQNEARRWIWGLHTEINNEQKIASPDVSEMGDMYGKRTANDLMRDIEECFRHLTSAVQRTHISLNSLRIFKYTLSYLRKFTD